MSTLVTRSGKGSPLTHNEVDTNFTNLNTDKVEKTAADITGGTINNTTVGATTPSTGVFTTLTAQNEVLKGTGQNLAVKSQQISTWGVVGSPTLTGNASTAPDGTTTATQIAFTTSGNGVYIFPTLVNGATCTYSLYVKNVSTATSVKIGCDTNPSTATVVVDVTSGVITSTAASITSSSITSVGSGWYRVVFSFVATSSSISSFVIYNNSGTSQTLLAWGAQAEISSTVGTYVPTTTTAVYGTPTLSFSGVASIGLQSDGSLYETSAGTGNVRFYTNNIGQEQARVSHTASAVNYHQLTGSATGSGPIHSVAGSDTNIDLNLTTKGTGSHKFNNGGGQLFLATSAVASPTNYMAMYGSTGSPQIRAEGTGSALDIEYLSKSTGGHRFFTQGTSYAEQFRISNTTSAVNYLQVAGSVTGNAPYFIAQGSDTNINFAYTSKGTGGHDFYTSGFSFAPQFKIANTTSAVNYIQIQGGTTGNSPSIQWQGSDANIQAAYLSKGSGIHSFFSGLGSRKLLQLSDAASAVNFVEIIPSATGVGVRLIANGTDTNIPLVLQPKGTGALQAQQTTSTATGGNARGANAVDWQTSRASASQVASATASNINGGANNSNASSYSTIGGGYGNTLGASNGTLICGGSTNSIGAYPSYYSTIVGGANNTANGWGNFIGGGQGNFGTSGSAVTTQSGTMNATTAVTLSGSNANIKVGQIVTGTSIANNTYVAAISGTSLTLSQAASGSSTSTLSFYTPHGVVVGGGNNQATGSYSFIGGGGDAGTAANRNVASGDFSVVCGGTKNTASGLSSFIGGGGRDANGNVLANTASGIISFIGGGFNNSATAQGATIVGGASNVSNAIYGAISGGVRGSTRAVDGYHAFPACVVPIADSPGVSQAGLLVIARQTTDATATVLTSNTGGASTTNQLILGNNSAYAFKGTVIANVTGGGNTKAWAIEGAIKRGANAASTALVGTPTVTSGYADAGASTWAITATADTTNGGLAITFTGQASTTIRVVAKLETTEVTF